MNKYVGYDSMRDFTHIAYFGGISNMVIVHPSLGVKTYQEFVARVKAEGRSTTSRPVLAA